MNRNYLDLTLFHVQHCCTWMIIDNIHPPITTTYCSDKKLKIANNIMLIDYWISFMFLQPLNLDNVHPCCCTVSAYLCIKPLFRMSDELPWALFVIQIWMNRGKIGWFRTRYKYHWHDGSLHCHCRSSRWKKCLFCSALNVYLKVFGACLKKLFINALISMAN